jgi:hypothetical protein
MLAGRRKRGVQWHKNHGYAKLRPTRNSVRAFFRGKLMNEAGGDQKKEPFIMPNLASETESWA